MKAQRERQATRVRNGGEHVQTALGPGPRASSAKTRGFHTQLDEGPETP